MEVEQVFSHERWIKEITKENNDRNKKAKQNVDKRANEQFVYPRLFFSYYIINLD